MTWHSFETRLGQINYLISGTGKNKLVHLHGGYGGVDAVPMLARNLGPNWSIRGPALPGHGRSFPLTTQTTYLDILDSLYVFINSIDVGTDYVLAGHSFGARLAWDLVQLRGLNPAKLLLFSPLLNPLEGNFLQVAYRIVTDFLPHGGLTLKDLTTYGYFNNFARPASLYHVWRIIKSLTQIEISSSRIDTMIVWGEKDAAIKLSTHRDLLTKLAISELLTYPGGHYSFTSANPYWPQIIAFLKR